MSAPSYQILSEIARGGVATLQKVMLNGGVIAVRRVLQARKLFSLRVRNNFLDGAAARAALSRHPNMVNSICFGGKYLLPYEFIEFVDGKDLKSLMAAGDSAIRANRLTLLREMAGALAWVHAHGFMHLDVKPENFLVMRRGQGITVKLTDFDMVRRADDNGRHRQYGTPSYMAPEQFKFKQCYPASDVFAFGLVVYQLLTGKMPFTGSTPLKAWRAQASSRVQPRHLHELLPAVDPALEAIVMKCLAKPLPERYADMGQVAADLMKLTNA